MIDLLFVGYDSCPNDKTTLTVCVREGRGYKIVKIFTDKEAEELYKKLTQQEDKK